MMDPKAPNPNDDPNDQHPGDATATGDRRATPREGDEGCDSAAAAATAHPHFADSITERIPIRLSPRIAAREVGGTTAASAAESYRPHVTSGEISVLDLYTAFQESRIENRDQHNKVDAAIQDLRTDLRDRDIRLEKRLDVVEANYTQLRSEFDIRKGRLAVWWLLISTSGIAIVRFLWPKAGDFLTRLFHGQASH